MSAYGKFSLGLVFLLIAGAQVQAQWRSSNGNPMSANGGCRDIDVTVTDAGGMGIVGADVSTENSAFSMTTNSDGFVAIPCPSSGSAMSVLTVTATGYQPAQVTLIPDARSNFTVRLDKREPSVLSAGTTVNASELSANVQKQSAQLQQQAEKLLAARDYESAEKLLLDSLVVEPESDRSKRELAYIAKVRRDSKPT